VRRGDDEFFAIAKWVVFALIEAEEYGITQANVDQLKKDSKDPVIGASWAPEDTGKLLGLDKDWAYRAIKAVGNYGEIFERNVGPKSALGCRAACQQPVVQGRLHVRPAGALRCGLRPPSCGAKVARQAGHRTRRVRPQPGAPLADWPGQIRAR
jgi:hypothetical protein